MSIAVELTVAGRVQGVFFRAFVRDNAHEHGVSGWAENRPDGTVGVRLEGLPADVDAVEAACRRGPERSRVDSVERREVPVEGLKGFETR